ncbi:MAG: rhamnulokinase [Bacillota bacterium]
MLKLLAFDYGASSGRAILGKFDGNRLSLEEVSRFPNEPVMVGESLYWDVLRLYHEMKQGILKCVSGGNKEIASIGIDTWGVDFGLLDASGKLLANPYHYRDKNTEGMIEEACKIVPRREIYEQTGIQFMVFNTLYQLLSLKINNSPLLEKASAMLFMPDLFRYFLTGEKSCEYTIASTSQMLNPKTGEWARPLLEKLGIPQNILTGIVDAGNIAGKLRTTVSDELNIGAIPVVAVAEHDTGSAVVSIPAIEGRYAYLSSGTWSLLGVELEEPLINDLTYNLDYTNEGGLNRTARLLKNIMGLWIYQECKRAWDKMGEEANFDQLEEGALKSEPFKALIDPDDGSFYHPGNMPEKIRDFCRRTGQEIPGTKPEIVRCVMESLALKYRMTLEGLEKIVGYSIPVLHIVGGGCRNAVLSQFTADAIARPVIAGPVEATAAGNLITQLIALGEIKNVAEGRKIIKNSFSTFEYLPASGLSWETAYERFLKIKKV